LLRVGLLIALVVALAGCRAGFPADELPDDPIAFMRQEAKKGISGLDEFREALRIENPDEPSTLRARRTTTLSLLDPKSGKVTPVPGIAPGVMPFDWSSDGSKLLFGRYDRGVRAYHLSTWHRYTGALDAVNPRRSYGTASISRGPIRVAGVDRIATDRVRALGITLNLEGRGIVNIEGGAPGGFPNISPDGRSVVFERPSRSPFRDATLLLWRVGGGPPRPLTRGQSARFSRDGQWITFTRRRDGQKDVWLMRADGTGKRALTDTVYDEEFPAVSPDGSFVVFASVRPPGKESQLFIVRASDRREKQLTQTGQNSRPIW
jgi:Tol biopolymer transport system component